MPIIISGRKSNDVRVAITNWFQYLTRNLFESITFDCGKKISDWQDISNISDINIYFANPGCPSQHGLNEHSNGLLRRDKILKGMDFTDISQETLSQTAHFRNEIPRKSLGYKTPIKVSIDFCKKLD
ncbi:MAG TPA: IS30 family transposase [Globicatella sulfidifaciens]|nr:IS30 family transposase [Globicatella sulfidifaciens]